MNETLKVKIVLGSTREGRFSEHAGAWIAEQFKKHPEIETDVLDLRDYEMPFFNQAATPSSKKEPYALPVVAQWTAKINEADAYVFVTPEYNRGYSGVLKNAIDWVSPEWKHKPVAFVSYGSFGGVRAVEQLRLVAAELDMTSVRQAVCILTPWMLRDETGALKPGALDATQPAAEDMITNLSWWAAALKTARQIEA